LLNPNPALRCSILTVLYIAQSQTCLT